jgi:hypothetical protein
MDLETRNRIERKRESLRSVTTRAKSTTSVAKITARAKGKAAVSAVAESIADVMVPEAPPKERTLSELYYEFNEKTLAGIKETLEYNFPDRWELNDVLHGSLEEVMTPLLNSLNKDTTVKNEEVLKKMLKGTASESSTYEHIRYTLGYQITIHFPELFVTNKNRTQKPHKVTDLYVRMVFTPLFNDAIGHGKFFQGARTSLTFAEICTNYTFSHLSGSWNQRGFSDFCLGSTEFNAMCMDMANEWNPTYFEIFCQQLPDYLSWESLDGGPYRKIGEITENAQSRGGHVNPTAGELTAFYRKFLQSKHKFDAEIVANQFYYGVLVLNDEKFQKAVTDVIDDRRYLWLYNKTTKVSNPEIISNRTNQINDIKRDRNFTSTILTFKGTPVKLRITDEQTDKKEVEFTKDNRVAHPNIVTYIIKQFQDNINKFIIDEYRNK